MGRPAGLNHLGATWPRLTDTEAARVEANVRLVYWAVNRANVPESQRDDRVQDGMIGLVRAAQMFDPDRGFTFATYAMFWIRQAITRGHDLEAGANHRQALRRGEEYAEPVSLDRGWDADDDHPFVLGELIADPVADVERRALAAAQLAEVRARLATMDLDLIDRAIADDLLQPSELSWRQREMALAERFGRQHEVIRQRRQRLQAVLRGERPYPARSTRRLRRVA